MSDYVTKQDLQNVQDILTAALDKAVTDLSDSIASFAAQVDTRFTTLEGKVEKLQTDMNLVLNRLDAINRHTV